MKVLFRVGSSLFLITLLTLLTQVGGLVYLLYLPLGQRIRKQVLNPWAGRVRRWAVFSIFYLTVSWLLVPPLARPFGRVPLPWRATKEAPLRPVSLLTCLTNRHYVRPALRNLLLDVARKTNRDNGRTLLYLDANFPFLEGFPLLPHRSHDDGGKVDLAFCYRHPATGVAFDRVPAWLGYGVCEEPRPGEYDQPRACAEKGFWQYGLLRRLTPVFDNRPAFDEQDTAALLRRLAAHPGSGKIFLEPHLKQRLGLTAITKIRFHGCAAVRHDDHIHVQL